MVKVLILSIYHQFPESLILMIPAISKVVKRGSAIKRTNFKIPKYFSPIFLGIAILFYTCGCIPYYIPTQEHGFEFQKEVTKDMVKQLEPGATTKEDVRLLLGEPTKSTERFWYYHWTRKDGYYGYFNVWDLTGNSDKHIRTYNDHAFCLEFMPDDKLKRFKHFESDSFANGEKGIHHQILDWKNEED